MRRGKTLRQRTEELGFINPDWDERLHDIVDFLELDVVNFDKYQRAASRTANKELTRELTLATFALGLAGEAGEVADLIKKHLGHGHWLNKDEIRKELGDVLWYLATVAEACGLSLEEVAAANIVKLQARYPTGFSSEASKNRKDESSGSPGTVAATEPSGGRVCRNCEGQGCQRCGDQGGFAF